MHNIIFIPLPYYWPLSPLSSHLSSASQKFSFSPAPNNSTMVKSSKVINRHQGGYKSMLALAFAIIATISSSSCNAFTTPISKSASVNKSHHHHASSSSSTMLFMISDEESTCPEKSRRSVLSSLFTTAVGTSVLFLPSNKAFAEAETMERGGVPLTPFNSLAFNYRGAFNWFYLHLSFSVIYFTICTKFQSVTISSSN